MTTFFVPGRAAAQGSKRHVGHGRMIEQSKYVEPWRRTVAAHARDHVTRDAGIFPTQAVGVRLEFVVNRPKYVDKLPSTPMAVKRPDIDKMARAVLDACTGILWSDDSLVTSCHPTKRLAEPGEQTGVHITYWRDSAERQAAISAAIDAVISSAAEREVS